MARVAVINGVNLDRLGHRDPTLYGHGSLPDLERDCIGWGLELGLQVEPFQTNHEGGFVEHVHSLSGAVSGAVVNPGAWTHYSYAIADALADLGAPVVEVHLSDIDNREPFRRVSVLEGVRAHRVVGRGVEGYRLALEWLASRLAPASS
jgi:3-dehydroquinate dehydratase-2